jgi:hypothetical protein
LVVLARLALLLVAAGAVAGGMLLSRRPSSLQAPEDAPYVCPMHWKVRSATPGSCPICGMALERRETVGRRPEVPSYNVWVMRPHAITLSIRAPARLDGDRGVTVLLHRDEMAALAADEEATFEPTGGGAPLTVRRRGTPPRRGGRRDAPARPWDDDTFEVSFDAGGAAAGAASGTPGWAVFAPRREQIVVVPETALVPSSDGAYVMVASRGDRTFTRRKVSTGKVTIGNVPIVDGLAAGERIATRRTLILEAARQLRDPGRPEIEVDR